MVGLFDLISNAQSNCELIWENQRPAGISAYISNASKSDVKFISVRKKSSLQNMLGDIHFIEDRIEFRPLVPFSSNINYELYLREELFCEFSPTSGKINENNISVKVYPGSDTLPNNLLKWYFHFSTPMRQGNAYDYLHIINNSGDTINAMLELKPELWNDRSTILTVWLDPGRIKRELLLNEAYGTPLRKNEKYTLIISSGWQAVSGEKLAKHQIKSFKTIKDDRNIPNPSEWRISFPATGADTLQIDFGESMDFLVLKNAIHIIQAGREIKGVTELLDNESIYAFYPESQWEKGKYTLVIESRLEDLAGNNLNRLFDVDLEGENQKRKNEIQTLEYDFSIK